MESGRFSSLNIKIMLKTNIFHVAAHKDVWVGGWVVSGNSLQCKHLEIHWNIGQSLKVVYHRYWSLIFEINILDVRRIGRQ